MFWLVKSMGWGVFEHVVLSGLCIDHLDVGLVIEPWSLFEVVVHEQHGFLYSTLHVAHIFREVEHGDLSGVFGFVYFFVAGGPVGYSITQ